MIAAMTTLLRRFLVLAALMFWQGGFTFYAAVVVPIGTEELGSARSQGFITRRVAQAINLAGVIAMPILAWDAAAGEDPNRRRRLLRALSVVGMIAGMAILLWLFPRMDELLDADTHAILQRKTFRRFHRVYLWVSSIQWGLGVIYTILTVVAWRSGRSQVG
jgi:hypothetical protein